MKNTIIFTVILAHTSSSSALASAERSPTSSEIKTIRQLFRQEIKRIKSSSVGAGYVKDRRSKSEIQAHSSFVSKWSKVNSSISPFLGRWSGYEDSYHIYPSKKRNKVCVIQTGEGHGRFIDSTISNSIILLEDHKILFKEGAYLGSGAIQNNKPSTQTDVPYNSPITPKLVDNIVNELQESEKDLILRKFKKNLCTLSLSD
jgi:hypothetical protein